MIASTPEFMTKPSLAAGALMFGLPFVMLAGVYHALPPEMAVFRNPLTGAVAIAPTSVFVGNFGPATVRRTCYRSPSCAPSIVTCRIGRSSWPGSHCCPPWRSLRNR